MAANSSVNRILMTTDTLGGIWTYAVGLARQLSLQNIEVSLASMGKKLTRDQWQEAAAIDGLTIHESEYKLEWMDDPWQDLNEAGEWLLDLERDFRPDVVHLNSYSFGSLPFSSPVVLVCHSCVYSWWMQVKGHLPQEENWHKYYQTVRHGLESADQLVAITRAYGRQISEIYKLNKDEIKIIYNGLNPLEFSPGPKKDYIFGMGRLWDDSKNFKIAESFADKLKWPVKLAGSINHPIDHSEHFIKHAELTGHLSRAEVKKELSEAAVYILPALYEPFGLTALEAALSGCALVLSDIPSLQEIWKDAALFISPGNTAGWKDALDLLINNKALRELMSRKAMLRAHNFSIEKMAVNYIGLYNQIKEPKPFYI